MRQLFPLVVDSPATRLSGSLKSGMYPDFVIYSSDAARASSSETRGLQVKLSTFTPCRAPHVGHSSTSRGYNLARIERWHNSQKVEAARFLGKRFPRTCGSGVKAEEQREDPSLCFAPQLPSHAHICSHSQVAPDRVAA